MLSFAGFWSCIVAFSALGTTFAGEIKAATEKSNNSTETLKITIFYESECPYSVEFFNEQVLPNYKLFSGYLKFDFVPYGGAKQHQTNNGSYEFDCQHGELECKENKLQACAIDQLSTESPSLRDDFIICYMSKEDKDSAAKTCAKGNTIIDLKKLKSCANGERGRALLAEMGYRTRHFRPKIRAVPTIVFNNVYKRSVELEARQNLKLVICQKLNEAPEICRE